MRKVLLIEDDFNTRNGMLELLQLEGFQVNAVADGCGARAVYDEQTEIIIADYNLPDTNGVNIIAELTGNNPNSGSILITAYLSPDVLAQAGKAGICNCISKPIDIDHLLQIMQVLPQHSLTPGLPSSHQFEIA